ncbi:sigma-70 family RNA polymerase sigma factor [Parapedobacter soli]|uniref:sigma-70 family RNA polymerase sigma factor n=1 Tax=Parapedobacter soli TaxID=416955 RepID=UPI0021C83938|nr:sigma-70 family RNA polymerase sigma factor [Parapedobacter soli]
MLQKEEIDQYRGMLFSIAYNMLGMVSDAEDMVQETYASWMESDKSHVKNVKFYLIRTISNKCISHLRKLKKERVNYIGTWLPEPVQSALDPAEEDPKNRLSIGFLYLLEKLTPIERAVMILREAFDLPYTDISEIFKITQDQCRQYFHRAKKKLLLEKSRFTVDAGEHEKILREFLDACLSGNLEKIIGLLRDDVTAYADGGGNAPAILMPLSGKSDVVKLLTGSAKRGPAYDKMDFLSINGLSGAAFYHQHDGKSPDALIAIDIGEDAKIANIYYLVNPEKLRHLS